MSIFHVYGVSYAVYGSGHDCLFLPILYVHGLPMYRTILPFGHYNYGNGKQRNGAPFPDPGNAIKSASVPLIHAAKAPLDNRCQ